MIRTVGYILCALTLLPSDAVAATLQERLAAVAARGDTVLRFEERRSAGLFSGEVSFMGRLEYDPATGRLTKAVETPEPSRLTISENYFEYTDSKRTRRVALTRRPELAALMISVRALLTGNAADLQTAFITDYEETGQDRWRLSLGPRDSALSERLSELTMHGLNDQVLSIEVTLADGKQQRMIILSDAP